MSTSIEMPQYQSHKKVWALKVSATIRTPSAFQLIFEDKRFAPKTVDAAWFHKHRPDQGPGYLVVYQDGYESYSPAAAFEEGYQFVGSAVDFGEAIRALKAGKRVARCGWNDKEMWLSLSCGPNGDAITGRREIAAENFWSKNNSDYALRNGGSAVVLPCITMKTASGEILMGWLASQTDMLADDWVIF